MTLALPATPVFFFDPSRLWLTTKAREEGAGHVHRRSRLSPELSAHCIFGSGNWGMRGPAIESQRRRGREVLSGVAAKRNQRARRTGGHGIFTLVRALAERAGDRGVDRQCCGDQSQASPQAKNRPSGCSTVAEVARGKSLSAHLGAQSRESGSATIALAPASARANAYADHESAAGAGHERGPALEASLVERGRASRAGEVSVGSLGQPASERFTRTAGPHDSQDRRTYRRRRTANQEMPGSTTVDDAPWSGPADGPGLRANHRNSRKVPTWQKDRQLHRAHSERGFQRRAATAGTHQQTRQRIVAFFAGGSSA